MGSYTPQRREYNKQTAYKSQREYINAKCKVISLTLNYNHDKDILDHLETKSNRTGYIKELIRRDMLNNC